MVSPDQFLAEAEPVRIVDHVGPSGVLDSPSLCRPLGHKVQHRADAGTQKLMLHTLTPSLDQLELIAGHVVDPFRHA